jgi:hypothetical protein
MAMTVGELLEFFKSKEYLEFITQGNLALATLEQIKSEFGTVEECVKAARYGRECANQQAWKDNYQEESDGS